MVSGLRKRMSFGICADCTSLRSWTVRVLELQTSIRVCTKQKRLSMSKADKRRNPVLLQHGLSIGNNAAESDDEFLFDCFVHYPPVESCKDPRHPGMILGGRTGAGKTAILRYLANTEERVHEIDPGEMAMSYVANSDILNFVQTIGGDLDLFFQIL